MTMTANAEYRVKARFGARNAQDPEGWTETSGHSLHDAIAELESMGYREVFSVERRYVTDWAPADHYTDGPPTVEVMV